MEGMFTAQWFTALGSILLLDLILSGDNAIVIALACKNLPDRQKLKGMFIGGFGAVVIRIVCTLFATGLLAAPYLEFIGGAALLYIAVHLLAEQGSGAQDDEQEKPNTLLAAVKTILVADFIMSMDNVLSLAGVANTTGDAKWSLIICGLLISIPIVLCGAQLFLLIMLKVPAIIYFGAGILAYTAAELMVMDQGVGGYIAAWAPYMKVLFVAGVLTGGWYLKNRQKTAGNVHL